MAVKAKCGETVQSIRDSPATDCTGKHTSNARGSSVWLDAWIRAHDSVLDPSFIRTHRIRLLGPGLSAEEKSFIYRTKRALRLMSVDTELGCDSGIQSHPARPDPPQEYIPKPIRTCSFGADWIIQWQDDWQLEGTSPNQKYFPTRLIAAVTGHNPWTSLGMNFS